MTTPVIPDFIISLFENEIRKIVTQIIESITQELKVDQAKLEDMIQTKLKLSLQIVPENTELVRIQRIKPRKVPPMEDRCMAMIMRNGILSQCHHYKKIDDFCTRHNLCHKYGTMNDDIKELENKFTKKYRACKKIY